MAEKKTYLEITPQATPRLKTRVRYIGGKAKAQTYVDEEYKEYKKQISEMLNKKGFFDDTLQEILSNPEGVFVSMIFEMPFTKRQKNKTTEFAITKPDIDNLQKAVLDAIFQSEYLPSNYLTGAKVDDARVTGVKAIKTRCDNAEDKGGIFIKFERLEDYLARESIF